MRNVSCLLLFSIGFCLVSNAQKVKRKGMPPIDVSKNKRSGGKLQGPVFEIGQLNGKWQEISRTDENKAPVDFEDTVLLNFSGNKVTTRETKSMISMVGAASIEQPGNTLLAAGDVYTVLGLTDSSAVLDDGITHTFKKTEHFHFENYGRLSVKQDVYQDPVPVTLPELMGKWSVYKREAKPGTINPPVNIIEILKINDSTSENTAKGEVIFYQTPDKSIVLPCIIKVNNGGFDITAGEYSWSLFVYKAAQKELVFGEAGVLLYYAKGY